MFNDHSSSWSYIYSEFVFFSTCFIFTDQDFHMYLEFKQLPPLTLESNVYWKQILFNVLLHATL